VNPTPPTFSARLATPGDLEEIAALLHQVFGIRTDPATLLWKYTGCSGKFLGSTLLTHRARIVGFLGQVPLRARIAGRDILATQGVDVAILEEYRRLDAFLTLIQGCAGNLEAAGVGLTYGTANTDASIPLSTLLGQHTVSAIPLLVRPLGAGSLPASQEGFALLAHLLTACLDGAAWVTTALPSRHAHTLRLTPVERFDDRFDSLWARIRDDYPIMLVRNAATLNWRYVDIPGRMYERLAIENARTGECEGYIVLGMTHRDHRVRGRICDLVTPRQASPHMARMLIAAAVTWFRNNGADLADVWMLPHTHLRLPLFQQGFIPRRTRRGALQASGLTADTASTLRNANHWFLAMGDSDTV
jgi:Acetyltransferase (GNAT) domain